METSEIDDEIMDMPQYGRVYFDNMVAAANQFGILGIPTKEFHGGDRFFLSTTNSMGNVTSTPTRLNSLACGSTTLGKPCSSAMVTLVTSAGGGEHYRAM
jgi:hypothetical protein